MLRMKTVFALCFVGFLSQFFSPNNAAVVINSLNGPTRRWPYNVIPLRVNLAQTYNLAEGSILSAAAAQISIDLGMCVNFTFVQPGTFPGQPFMNVQPALSTPGSVTSMCFTYNGYAPAAGNNGQALIMFGSSSGNTVGGCLDNQRDAMRFLVNSLGLLNEWERSDRDSIMTFPSSVDRNSLVASTLQNKQLFSDTHKLNSTVAQMFGNSYSSGFDLNSVTMITGQRYAASNSQPVFNIANGGVVGQSGRLSTFDCQALKNLYGCPETGYGLTPTCASLTAGGGGGSVILNPNPAILTRSIQCSTTGAPSPLSTPMTLGIFWISGVLPSANQPSDPVPTLTPAINGVTPVVVKLLGSASLTGPVALAPDTTVTSSTSGGVTEDCKPSTDVTCVYAVKFQLTALPTKGSQNQQTAVNLVFASGSTSTTYSLPITININCAPQFVSVTAPEGIAVAMVTQRTLTFGTGITPQKQTPPASPIQSAVIGGADTIVAPFVVNYNAIPFGALGKNSPATTGSSPKPAATFPKVFINCLYASGDTPGTGVPTGTMVIGTVTATDPDGGSIKYYAFTGSFPTTDNPGGEKVDVTQDGIITISSYSVTTEGAKVPGTTTLQAFNAQAPIDGATKGTALLTTGPKEYFIVAIDSNGGQSVLRLQYYFQCAPNFI